MTSDPSSENRAGYDRWAQLYDTYVNSTVATDELYFPSVYAEVRHLDVLEIGCGTGRHTVRLASQGNRVTALDLSPAMLDVARGKLAGAKNVTLVEADIMIGGDWGQFDTVLTALVLEHISDLRLFFAQVSQALKPGGRFYMSEIHPDRIAGGTQANFVAADGEQIRLTSFAHAEADIQAAASQAGLCLALQQDVIGDDHLVQLNPDWVRHIGRRMIRIWVFAHQ
ncbi:class I SAM-dependent methyltransferase [Asticcacaulis biprosthecium]|uniref:class I SAM-dependent methyltransferase n=1 Tax=Asticcacaulis biprosthecium TaxID=76891 RepID=UPI00058D12FE|nr:class I SAM-dependent methyltransferase [Asticcacaulis biprosthecium]